MPTAHWAGYQARWPVGRRRALDSAQSGAARPGRSATHARDQGRTGATGQKQMTRASCPLAAPHFAPSSSRLLPRRAMSNSTARHPIIATQLRVPVPTQCNIRSPPPPGWISFLFASPLVHTSPHAHVVRGMITRFQTINQLLLPFCLPLLMLSSSSLVLLRASSCLSWSWSSCCPTCLYNPQSSVELVLRSYPSLCLEQFGF